MSGDADPDARPESSPTAREAIGRPSAFFRDCASRIGQSRDIGPALDVACGRGRHSLAAAELGLDVLALDRDAESLDVLRQIRPRAHVGRAGRITTRAVDLEATPPPALPTDHFGLVMVFRYLHRPLFPWIEARIAPGGWLVYETFTIDQRALGWGPRRSDFLLERGELRTLVGALEIEVFEEGLSKDDPPSHTARLLAKRSR